MFMPVERIVELLPWIAAYVFVRHSARADRRERNISARVWSLDIRHFDGGACFRFGRLRSLFRLPPAFSYSLLSLIKA